VGSVPRPGEDAHAAAWWSADGSTWTAASDDPAFSQHQMLSVAAGPLGLMAVGNSCAAGECGSSAAWSSPDGRTWQAASVIPQAAGSTPVSRTILAGGPGWIAAGRTFGTGDNDPGGIWTTADGMTWTAATLVDPSGETASNGVLSGLAAHGSQVVAVGTVPSAGHSAAVWTSSDATTWTRVPDEPSFAGGIMTGVAGTSAGYVAVGSDANGAAAWTSADGSTWTESTPASDFAGGHMTSVAAVDGHVLAVGFDSTGALAWRSPDGRSWTPTAAVSMASGAQAQGAAVGPKADVAVGAITGSSAIWTMGR
jgi:hypothetical protein